MRLQKALESLGRLHSAGYQAAALRHSELALRRAELALQLEEDKEMLRVLASRVGKPAA
ncbi:hypothetical protein [Paraburkholderia sp. BL9I2N2]|uniref:hypothetical protein n=1 Tax=Paraburkholderia sp. BL9I2N2 TaxID=1938809 RepID=UPI0014053DA2|nr:hypothetical protein [Paraburkholderia sp. BL9I2N2]